MFVLPVASASAAAQIVYKSISPDGSVVYSDKPPSEGKVEKIIEFPDLPSSPVPPVAVPIPDAAVPRHAIVAGGRPGDVHVVRQLAIPDGPVLPEVHKSELVAVAANPPPPPPRNPVMLYSATWCGYCKRAKAYLAEHNIEYDNIDIDTADGRAAFDRAGKGGIPLLVSGRKRVRGFRPEGYDVFFSR